MALPDLTGQNIEDTYQRILQVDGEDIRNGTGSIFVPKSAVTASFIDSVKVKNINEVTNEEKDHVLNILRLLIREDINLNNVSVRKNKLNHIVATYLEKHPINEQQKDKIVNGVISGLSKLK